MLLLAVASATLASTLGLTGFTASAENVGTRVTATVSAGVPCGGSAATTETVTYGADGRERRARFDGCGHTEGELVEITVPPDAPDDVLVHSAGATVGDGAPGEGLGGVLLVAAALAGAGYAFLVRRGPRGTPPPPALRLR